MGVSNWTTLRIAVTMVGAITLLTVFAITIILLTGGTAPDGLIAIGAGGVGALATLLTGSSVGEREEIKLRGAIQAAVASPETAKETSAAIASVGNSSQQTANSTSSSMTRTEGQPPLE